MLETAFYRPRFHAASQH